MSNEVRGNNSVKAVVEFRRSTSKSRSTSKNHGNESVSYSQNSHEKESKYQFYSLHEELTFLRNERVNFQRRSQLQYAEIKRLKQELKVKVHELSDCKEKLKAYEVEEYIQESNSASNGKKYVVSKSNFTKNGNNEIVNYCVTKDEKTTSAAHADVQKENNEHSPSDKLLEEKQAEQMNANVIDSNGINTSIALRTDNKVINELRRNLAQRDSALHDVQLRNIELDTARDKMAREVERIQHELLNVSEERNTLNNKLLDKDREIDRLNKELCAIKEQVDEKAREVERLLVRNKTYELLLHDKDDLCFAVGSTVDENESPQTNELKREYEDYYHRDCKRINNTPTALHAKRLPSQHMSSNNNNENGSSNTEESKVIRSVLHSQSLMFKQRMKEVQTELTNAKEREERVQQELILTQNEVDKCNKELIELREECKRLRDECVFHKEEVVLLHNKIETMNKENDKNRNNNNSNTNTLHESYVALMKLNRKLQRKLVKAQEVELHDSSTHRDNVNTREENVNTSNEQISEWKNKCDALQRTNDELQSDNCILARAAEILSASHAQKVNMPSVIASENTAELQHKLQNAQQTITDLQQRLSVVTSENVEYEMLITKIADVVPVQALLCK